ncbi:Mu transposase C-terminal domain-containing protein [Leisingera sp. ANG-M7]|uniref:Mu transposase C-terminal domain-containing protein n=1 Tax=Leisingera sp. ANG-M7 TaxID=1577902 RepID=UPI00057ED5F5|nr:Mu transposase C-terminal domain-containing protein [Leisingera sp. ANG-M7]KIC35916.1 hypothetical protein RA26_14630 [Leisingera sp. ANG-M7]
MISPVSKIDGRIITYEGADYTVEGPIPHKDVVQLRDLSGDVYQISGEVFRLHVSRGLVRETADPMAEIGRILTLEQNFEYRFKLKVAQEALRLREECVPWKHRRDLILAMINAHDEFTQRRKPFPKESAIRNWVNAYVKKGPHGLLPRTHRSGNRTDRCDALFREIVEDLIEQHYLPHDRMRISDLWNKAVEQYRVLCDEYGQKPGNHGRKIVESIVKNIPHDDVVKRRIGSKYYKTHRKLAAKFYDIKAPFDRVEIDSTQVDAFVVNDKRETIGRPYATAAIDCATGWILALIITLHPPNSETVALALQEAMTPFDDEDFEKYGIVNRLNVAARFKLAVFDQGPENSGDILDTIIRAARFEAYWAEPGNPQAKPFIEAFFKALSLMVTTLSGATKSQLLPAQKRTLKAEREACLTFDELNAAVQKWRFDEYGRTPRRRINNVFKIEETPTEAMERLAKEHLIPDPPTDDELTEFFWVRKEVRGGWKYGIEHERMQYFSNELGELLRRIGFGKKLEIRFNPLDADSIRVRDPQTGQCIKAYNKVPGLKGIPYSVIKESRSALSAHGGPQRTREEIFADILARQAEKQSQGTKMKRARAKEIGSRRIQQMLERSQEDPSLNGQVRSTGKPKPLEVPSARKLPKVERKDAL